MRINNIKITFYIWIFNFSIGIFVFYTFFNFLSISVGESIIPNTINIKDFYIFLIDVYQISTLNFSLVLSFILLASFIFIIISIFISGGIYSVLINKEDKTFKNLLISSTEYFFRFLMIFLINLINWIIVFLLSAGFFYLIWKILINSGNETLANVLFYLWMVITVLLIIIAVAIYDISRIIKIRTDKNFFYSIKKGIEFVFSHKRIIFFIFFVYSITIVFFHLLLSPILKEIENTFPVYLTLFVYQIFIIIKYFIKVILINTEVNLMSPEPE